MKKKFLLPLVMVGLLASCGSNTAPISAPTNGTEVDLKDPQTIEIIDIVGQKMLNELTVNEESGIGVEIFLSDVNFNYNDAHNPYQFDLKNGNLKFEFRTCGNIDETSFDDLMVYVNISISGDFTFYHENGYEKCSFNDNGISLYLNNSVAYLDLSRFQLFSNDGFIAICNLLSPIDISQIASSIQTIIDNNSKLALDLSNPIIASYLDGISIDENISDYYEEYQQALQQLSTTILDACENVGIEDYLNVYKYDDGSYAFEVKNGDKIDTSEGAANYTGSACAIINANGQIRSIGAEASITVLTADTTLFHFDGKAGINVDYNVNKTNCLKNFNQKDYKELNPLTLLASFL